MVLIESLFERVVLVLYTLRTVLVRLTACTFQQLKCILVEAYCKLQELGLIRRVRLGALSQIIHNKAITPM